MALDNVKIVQQVKDLLYSSGLGEKPSLRQGTGNATVTGRLVSFDVAAGQGAALRAGHVLSSYDSIDASDSYGFYVMGVDTDTVTAVNGYDGAAISDGVPVPELFEHQAPVTEFNVFRAIDNVVDTYLFPDVFDLVVDEFTPDFTTLQSDANPLDERVQRAWQKVGPVTYQLPCVLEDNMPVSLFPSGKMLSYDVSSTDTVYYSVWRRVSLGTSTGGALESMIAKGAAALLVEGTETSTKFEDVKADAEQRGRGEPASRTLWASFYQARRTYSAALARQSNTAWRIDRG